MATSVPLRNSVSFEAAILSVFRLFNRDAAEYLILHTYAAFPDEISESGVKLEYCSTSGNPNHVVYS